MKEAVRQYSAKMIVIDPRRIDLVDFAEMWLPLKPGTNVPVFSAMAHVIVKENLINHEFIANRTEGFKDFIESLRPSVRLAMNSWLMRYPQGGAPLRQRQERCDLLGHGYLAAL